MDGALYRIETVAQVGSWFDRACPLRARGFPSGAEAPLGRSLSRRLSEPFVPSRASGRTVNRRAHTNRKAAFKINYLAVRPEPVEG
ncbi:MAG: hypothetical protein Q8N70_06200 [Deltaproteobacteria bacterium]|nr:hypothetical protein [Deltaproteobacteria bacterium]